MKITPAAGNPQIKMYMPGFGAKTAMPTSAKAVTLIKINQSVPTLEDCGEDCGVVFVFSSGSFLNQLVYIF